MIELMCWWRFGFADSEKFAVLRIALQLLAVSLYAIHRVVTFHPAFSADYRQWLESTPWQISKPLPMGPVHLVGQDLIVVMSSMLLTRISDPRLLYIPTVFLFFYLVVLAIVSWITGQKIMAYVLGIAVALIAAAIQDPYVAIVVSCTSMLLAPIAVRRSLMGFPWTLPRFADGRGLQESVDEQKQKNLGWPFEIIPPKQPQVWIHPIDGWGIALLAGCWSSAILWQVDERSKESLMSGWAMILGAISISRILVYSTNYLPPISFRGRIVTLRIWQSGYDVIVLAPLLALIVGEGLLFLAAIANTMNFPAGRGAFTLPAWCTVPLAAASVGLSLLILLLVEPAVEAWRLTGRHRIVFRVSHDATGLGCSPKHPDFVQTA
jgi:hypothetical protein